MPFDFLRSKICNEPSPPPAAKTSGRAGDHAAVRIGAPPEADGSMVWNAEGESILYKRIEPSVDADKKTLRWNGEKRHA